jgi:transitional endoplasmic reticulum ATPase
MNSSLIFAVALFTGSMFFLSVTHLFVSDTNATGYIYTAVAAGFVVYFSFTYLRMLFVPKHKIDAEDKVIPPKPRTSYDRLSPMQPLPQKLADPQFGLVSKFKPEENTSNKGVGEKPSHNFSAVVGMTELKERLLRAGHEIMDSLEDDIDEESFSLRNGILLYGPPGTGKTFIAEALAGELELNIIKVNFGELASRWVNQTTERVMEVMQQAADCAPVVLFMDEIDAILPDRSRATASDSESTRLVSSFLPKIEVLRKAGVVIIGATNLLESLDTAAIREGRFDYKIEVPYPDEEARFSIMVERINKHTRAGYFLAVKRDMLHKAVKRWRGFSTTRLNAIVDECVDMMKQGKVSFTETDSGAKLIDYDALLAALRKVQGRNVKSGDVVVTLDALVLSRETSDILNNILFRMKHVEEAEALGAEAPNGILFSGPPGTGKTFTAKALANSADWSFLEVTGNDLLNDTKRIDELLKKAGDLRPCIVFIDEADDVFTNRSQSNSYASSVTNKLLSAMDGSEKRMPDIVFIAATNHPEKFDSAALRAGRFTEKVVFQLPSASEVERWVADWVAKKPQGTLSPELTIKEVSTVLNGLSIANIKGVMQQAINIVVSREDKRLTRDDVVTAKSTIVG